jgi:hypothetical protein
MPLCWHGLSCRPQEWSTQVSRAALLQSALQKAVPWFQVLGQHIGLLTSTNRPSVKSPHQRMPCRSAQLAPQLAARLACKRSAHVHSCDADSQGLCNNTPVQQLKNKLHRAANELECAVDCKACRPVPRVESALTAPQRVSWICPQCSVHGEHDRYNWVLRLSLRSSVSLQSFNAG